MASQGGRRNGEPKWRQSGVPRGGAQMASQGGDVKMAFPEQGDAEMAFPGGGAKMTSPGGAPK